ncbi:hypothetical protein GGR40_002748 [Novosphingobium gossypii]
MPCGNCWLSLSPKAGDCGRDRDEESGSGNARAAASELPPLATSRAPQRSARVPWAFIIAMRNQRFWTRKGDGDWVCDDGFGIFPRRLQ